VPETPWSVAVKGPHPPARVVTLGPLAGPIPVALPFDGKDPGLAPTGAAPAAVGLAADGVLPPALGGPPPLPPPAPEAGADVDPLPAPTGLPRSWVEFENGTSAHASNASRHSATPPVATRSGPGAWRSQSRNCRNGVTG